MDLRGSDPFDGGVGPGANGVGPRVNYWIAYKYELDVTVPSVGNPNPPPAPGGIWIWVGDWWSGYEGGASPSDAPVALRLHSSQRPTETRESFFIQGMKSAAITQRILWARRF